MATSVDPEMGAAAPQPPGAAGGAGADGPPPASRAVRPLLRRLRGAPDWLVSCGVAVLAAAVCLVPRLQIRDFYYAGDQHDQFSPLWHLFGAQLRGRARRRRERVLVFVDQFEEVYTLATEVDRDAFLACLVGAADDASSPLRLVISIRHDYLDRVASR